VGEAGGGVRVMGKGNFWPVKVRLFWCPGRNVPLLGPRCSSGVGPPLKLTEPGDARPAFRHDLEVVGRAFENEFGSMDGLGDFLGGGVVLLNKVPFMDEMKEIVSRGAVVGRVYYEPLEGRWRLRLSRPGILRLLDRGLFSVYVVEGGVSTLKRRRKIRVGGGSGFREGEQVVLLDEAGEPVGISYFRGGELVVHNVYYTMYPEAFARDAASTWRDAVEENVGYLDDLEDRAVRFLRGMYEKHGGPVIVSFSSGKDSLVALHLALRAGLEPVILFNNTGIELPETVEMVYRIADMWGLEVIESSAGEAFWRAVERLGPPGKDYRWCCKITKLAPLAMTVNRLFPDGALNVVGQRAFESLDRARSGRVWRNKWLPKLLNVSPIQYWSQLAVWLYIFRYRLPYNPLYERGFDRLGCFMCPAATVAEMNTVRETHPELWKRWESILYRWAVRIGYRGDAARLWVERGVWRWLTPAQQKQRLARRLGLSLVGWREKYLRMSSPRLSRMAESGDGVELVFEGGCDVEAVEDQYTGAGAFRRVGRGRYVVDGRVELVVDDGGLRVSGLRGRAAREMAYDVVKLVYRWRHCAGCRLCEESCPTGAIKVVEHDGSFRPVVDPGRCIHCKLCLDNCPVADVFVEKVPIALAEGEVTAWRRPWKRSRHSVVRRYQMLKLGGYRVEGEDDEGSIYMGA